MKFLVSATAAAMLAFGLASCSGSSSSQTTPSAQTTPESSSSSQTTPSAQTTPECAFTNPEDISQWSGFEADRLDRALIDDAVEKWLVPAGCVVPASNSEAWDLLGELFLALAAGPGSQNLVPICEATTNVRVGEREAELEEVFYLMLLTPREQFLDWLAGQLLESFLNRSGRSTGLTTLQEAAAGIANAHARCESVLE